MKLGIMQPYFFPYPGYFQLIAHCDTFVFYDDVQFIKGGWINRNRILCDDQPKWFTYPINSGSTFANICERYYVADTKSHAKLRNQLESSYRDATFFGDVIQLFQLIMEFPNKSIAEFNINLIRIISEHIGLKTNFLISSKLSSDKEFCGQERVLEIARLTKAKTYINPIGGTNLYNKQTFSNEGVDFAIYQT